jgi:signal transduction histidine kinase
VAVYSEGGHELDADWAVLPSRLAISGPPHEWIDLYFQLNQAGTLSSPQLDAEGAMWRLDNPSWDPAAQDNARKTLAWLKAAFGGIVLRECLATACACDRVTGKGPADASRTQTNREYQQRRETLRKSQENYLPPADCVDADIAERHVHSGPGSATAAFVEGLAQRAGEVAMAPDTITAFWLGEGPGGRRKLAFVRECHADAEMVFYQGFIGDWNRLKPELLAQIEDFFPEADLEPVTDAAASTTASSEARLINLPVRLAVPDIPGGAAAAAWRSIRGTLITTWAATAAVLLVAGWGLRNLVALTERRMQFAYAVTHELRTPLTTFRLYSDMLSAGLVPDASKQGYFETLDRESLRLSSLVEEVLEYARLENHKVRLNPTNTDGSTLLREIAETLEKRCKDSGVTPRTQNAIVNGQPLCTDVELVNRIAGVLVNNACRHARGRDDATVLVRIDHEDAKLHLDVIDSGPGIDRADLRTIFKPFRRGRKADGVAQHGIGLGLALARSWAALLGGRLEVVARHHPQYGGAHFRLTIPTRVRDAD